MLDYVGMLSRDDLPWFFCGALLVVLFLFLRFSIRGRRRSATFPTFSIALNSVSREDTYIVYQAGGKTTEFHGYGGRGKTFLRTCYFIELPKGMSDEEVTRVAPNLALGLSELGYDYRIYRNGVPLGKAALSHTKND